VAARVRRYSYLRRQAFGSAEIEFFEYETSGNRVRGLKTEPMEVSYVDIDITRYGDDEGERWRVELIDVDQDSAAAVKRIKFMRIAGLYYKAVGEATRPQVTDLVKQDWILNFDAQGTTKAS
jgi:hypothetical protein